MAYDRQYSDSILDGMQSAYGEGFLSPGGAEEVRQIMHGLSAEGRDVLDLGCGVGGASLILARELNAGRVVGVDVERQSLERAATAIKAAGLTDRITLKLIEPGPIPLSDDAFDIVVTKDVICHIPDKQSFFAEVFRVLRSGGIFASGDWIRGEEGSGTRVFNDWVEQLRGLKFHFETVRAYVQALESVGFTQIESRDHSDWSERIARQQLEDALGPARETSIQTLGKEGYKKRTALTRARLEALSNRDLQHWHLRASKP